MREDLFDELGLQCPSCRLTPEGMQPAPIGIASVERREGRHVVEGKLQCERESCRAVYPILFGVPVIVRDMLGWWESQYSGTIAMVSRVPKYFADLERQTRRAREMDSLIGTYLHAHFGCPHNANDFWVPILERIDTNGEGTGQAIDLGCGVGRLTFELAVRSDLTIGLDSSLAFLMQAVELQRRGHLSYSVKAWDGAEHRQEVEIEIPEGVVFVAGDALDPPFVAGRFQTVTHLNLIDAVADPLMLMGQAAALMADGGLMLGCSPFEWQDPKSGFSRFSRQSPAEVITAILADQWPQMALGLASIDGTDSDLDWRLRQHDRMETRFRSHLFAARKKTLTTSRSK